MGVGPETRLVNRIRVAIAGRWPDSWILKTHGSPYQAAGLPDLIVVLDGHVYGIEVKAQRPGETRDRALSRVTAQQRAMLDAMARAGATTGVALTVEEALAIIDPDDTFSR